MKAARANFEIVKMTIEALSEEVGLDIEVTEVAIKDKTTGQVVWTKTLRQAMNDLQAYLEGQANDQV